MFQNDYYLKMQEYSISQLRLNKDYLILCKCIGEDFNNIQKTCAYLLNMRNIDKAEGIWLDYLGWLVGTTRTYFDITKFFSVNSLEVNKPVYIYFKSQSISGQSNLNDELFRRRIYARIGFITTKGTREDNIFIIKNMTNAEKVVITKPNAMTLNIKLIGNNIIETNTIREDIENILAPGVGLNQLEISEAA